MAKLSRTFRSKQTKGDVKLQPKIFSYIESLPQRNIQFQISLVRQAPPLKIYVKRKDPRVKVLVYMSKQGPYADIEHHDVIFDDL